MKPAPWAQTFSSRTVRTFGSFLSVVSGYGSSSKLICKFKAPCSEPALSDVKAPSS